MKLVDFVRYNNHEAPGLKALTYSLCREKRATIIRRATPKLNDGTLMVEEKAHLRYYIFNNWTFLYNLEPYHITDDFRLVKIDFTVPIRTPPKQESEVVCLESKEVSSLTEKLATLSPHILIVVGSCALTAPTGRELSEFIYSIRALCSSFHSSLHFFRSRISENLNLMIVLE